MNIEGPGTPPPPMPPGEGESGTEKDPNKQPLQEQQGDNTPKSAFEEALVNALEKAEKQAQE